MALVKLPMRNKLIKLFISLSLPFLAGGIGSYFTTSSLDPWYSSLSKPFFNPPNWIFGPVWTTLYLLMGVSFYLYWITKGKGKIRGYKFFAVQLVLNTLWSIIFFGFQSPDAAFFIILILLIFIALTINEFRKMSEKASYLLYPYALWVGFATLLNCAISILN